MDTDTDIQAQLQRAGELLDQNQLEAAEQLVRDVLAAHPDDLKAQRVLGFVLLAQQRGAEAIDLFESILRASNQNPVAALDLAKALSQAGSQEKAADLLRETVARVATLSPGWYLLGDILVEMGDFDAARDAYGQATANDPFRLQIDQSKRSIQEGDMAKAERILRHILEQDPLHVEALAGIEVMAMANEHWVEAERLFRMIQNRTRYWPTLLLGLSQLFLMTNRVEEARRTLTTLVQIQPVQLLGWNMLGTANELLMRHDEAIEAFRRSLQLEPNQPRAHVSIGNIQRVIGQREESIRTFESALRFSGMNGEAYWGLSNLKDYEFSARQIADMQAALDADAHSLHNAAPMYFAMAKAQEDRGKYAAAFSYYVKGNQIQKRYSNFDSDTYNEEIGRIITTFGPDRLRSGIPETASAEAPIFVVGMPRTGSTLVEQVLASHSRVDATMELPFISQFVRELQAQEKDRGPFPECVDSLSADDLNALGQRYLRLSEVYRQGAPRFIDKMPNNFVHIGLIHLLLPNAVFIDVVRNPLDTCLSNYKQRFAIGQSFSYALEDLGHYYRGYRRLMAHWQSLLPDRVYTLVYERLVSNPDEEIRKLLDFCGLDFEEACLSPEKTKRAIRTPSSEQVRQPVSASRIGYWRNFERHLGPLKTLLASEIAAYDEAIAP